MMRTEQEIRQRLAVLEDIQHDMCINFKRTPQVRETLARCHAGINTINWILEEDFSGDNYP